MRVLPLLVGALGAADPFRLECGDGYLKCAGPGGMEYCQVCLESCECPPPPADCAYGEDLCFEPAADCTDTPLSCLGREYCAARGSCPPIEPTCGSQEHLCRWEPCPAEYPDGVLPHGSAWCQAAETPCPEELCCNAGEVVCFDPEAGEYCALECPTVGWEEPVECGEKEQKCRFTPCKADTWLEYFGLAGKPEPSYFCAEACPPEPACCMDHDPPQKTCFHNPETTCEGSECFGAEFCVAQDAACPVPEEKCGSDEHQCRWSDCKAGGAGYTAFWCVPKEFGPCPPEPVCCPEDQQTCWQPPAVGAACDPATDGCFGQEYCAAECPAALPLELTCRDFDEDQSGGVDLAEVSAQCEKCGVRRDDCLDAFNIYDLDGDGSIDCVVEFEHAEEYLRFHALDANDDGVLCEGELVSYCVAHGFDPEQCEDLLAYCDGDHDGKVKFDEFVPCEPPQHVHVVQGTGAHGPAAGPAPPSQDVIKEVRDMVVEVRDMVREIRDAVKPPPSFLQKALRQRKARDVRVALWKGALPRTLTQWAAGHNRPPPAKRAERDLSKAPAGVLTLLGSVHARRLAGKRPDLAATLTAGPGAVQAFRADLHRLAAKPKHHALLHHSSTKTRVRAVPTKVPPSFSARHLTPMKRQVPAHPRSPRASRQRKGASSPLADSIAKGLPKAPEVTPAPPAPPAQKPASPELVPYTGSYHPPHSPKAAMAATASAAKEPWKPWKHGKAKHHALLRRDARRQSVPEHGPLTRFRR